MIHFSNAISSCSGLEINALHLFRAPGVEAFWCPFIGRSTVTTSHHSYSAITSIKNKVTRTWRWAGDSTAHDIMMSN